MRHIDGPRTALAVGTVVGLFHFFWAALVAAGWAKPLLDFILGLHFIQLDIQIAPFAIGTAAVLVALTFGVGAVFGLVFAAVWNRLAGDGG
jgi:hypothetical protein